MAESNEKELIKGTPSLKTLPLFFIFAGIILLIITITTHWSWDDFAAVMMFVSPAISIVGIILYIYSGKCSIVVTDKRVYGKAGFGSQVDLPFDMISAVGTTGITHGIEVATSSGKIKFMYIANASDIHKVISDLLMDRQENKNSSVNVVKQEVSDADELKKFKGLLDQGIISQEEFDAKKKQLLGL
jgi:hypothetical protein